jgi:hypothetical protein
MAQSQSAIARDYDPSGAEAPIAHPAQITIIANSYVDPVSQVREILGRDLPVAMIVIPAQFQVHPGDVARWAHIESLDTDALEAYGVVAAHAAGRIGRLIEAESVEAASIVNF